MCTRVLQDEVAKRRAVEDALRPLARAVFAQSLSPEAVRGIADVIGEARDLIVNVMKFRECCITLPSERHAKGCKR